MSYYSMRILKTHFLYFSAILGGLALPAMTILFGDTLQVRRTGLMKPAFNKYSLFFFFFLVCVFFPVMFHPPLIIVNLLFFSFFESFFFPCLFFCLLFCFFFLLLAFLFLFFNVSLSFLSISLSPLLEPQLSFFLSPMGFLLSFFIPSVIYISPLYYVLDVKDLKIYTTP
jgi:hypothetical protein